MTLALIIVQLLATVFLGATVKHASRIFNIPLTIHNLPIVLMNVLMLILTLWLSIVYLPIYLMVGSIFSLLLLVTADYSKNAATTVMISLSAILIWGQLITFIAFCALHQDKLET